MIGETMVVTTIIPGTMDQEPVTIMILIIETNVEIIVQISTIDLNTDSLDIGTMVVVALTDSLTTGKLSVEICVLEVSDCLVFFRCQSPCGHINGTNFRPILNLLIIYFV